MESNWRIGLLDHGISLPPESQWLTGYTATLIARLITPKMVNGFLCTHIIQFRFFTWLTVTYAWTSLSGCVIGITGNVPQVGGFPHGETVYPDN